MSSSSPTQSSPARYPELRGQVAIITGSARGIGKGIAERLASEGMRIVVNSNEPDAVELTAAELRQQGGDVLAVTADLSRSDEVRRLIQTTVATFGIIDVVVNNAADLRRYNVFDVDEAILDYQLALNIKSPYLCAQYAAEVMRQQGHGNIISISSVAGTRAHWQGLPYDVTKGAIDSMTQAMALELAAFGIRVNAVAPGPIRNSRAFHGNAEELRPFIERVPLGRIGQPADIAAAIAFLASNEASFITGQVIYVDGGLTAQLTPKNSPI